MNKFCIKKCAYKNICNLNKEKTVQCKVADDKEAQEFKEFLLAQPLQNYPTAKALKEFKQ
jgi:hypothetical protein